MIVNEERVLDHGFVKLRNVSGPTRRIFDRDPTHLPGVYARQFDADDIDTAQAARMSFDQMDSGRTREQDLALADYLMRNAHWSPFEMIEVWVEMKLPIFTARQFVRHEASINEVSGRYVTLPAEWYIPKVVGGKAANKKQGQEDNLDETAQKGFKIALDEHCRDGYNQYKASLELGVAPEHARMLLSLNHYTHWLWKQNLRDMLFFLRARLDSHAQIEARAYGHAIEKMLRQALPATMELFDKYVKNA